MHAGQMIHFVYDVQHFIWWQIQFMIICPQVNSVLQKIPIIVIELLMLLVNHNMKGMIARLQQFVAL